MKTFSQRHGLAPSLDVAQIDGMTIELRNSIWNVLDQVLWSSEEFMSSLRSEARMRPLGRLLWLNYFKRPIDTLPEHEFQILKEIRTHFFSCKWNQVYDLLEFLVQWHNVGRSQLPVRLNVILERELAGYRFISGFVSQITDKQEMEMLDDALRDSEFVSVNNHLASALQHLSRRENPDYRNSIKESVSAVECMARIVAQNPKATLPDALKVLEKSNRLHPALKDGFSKLYGYTSDADGIRHAMLDEPNLTVADAKFFLLSCTSFVNYLKSQLN